MMARSLNIGYRTYQKYEQEGGNIDTKVWTAFTNLGFNVGWFFNDNVPMLIQESTSSPAQQPTPSETSVAAGDIPDDDIGLGESVELLAKIYNSGNQVLVRAIAANLHAFSEAVDNKALAMKTVGMMEEMNKRMLSLEEKLAKMESEGDGKTAASA